MGALSGRAGDGLRGRVRVRLPFAALFVRYLVYALIAAFAVALAAYVAFGVLVNSGLVYAAIYAQDHVEQTAERVAEADAVNDAVVPSAYRWTWFAADGSVLASSMSGAQIEEARGTLGESAVRTTGPLGDPRYYRTVERPDGTACVLTYDIMPQFATAELRDRLPNPQNLLVGMAAAVYLAMAVALSVRFAHVVKRKLAPVIAATERVAQRDLDFAPGESNVREIDDVLRAMEDMRVALKASLEGQWRAEQHQREQISALAHDLKTPLTIVRGNAELLAETALDDEQRACVRDIEEGGSRMGDYLRELIELSHAAERRGGVERIACAKLAEQVVARAVALGRPKRITVVRAAADAPEGAPKGAPTVLHGEVEGDVRRLLRALENVVANGVEHARVHGELRVTAGCDDGMLRIVVEDDGPGFTPEALRRGRQRFYQGDESRTSDDHFGLGLATAFATVKAHGGGLELANGSEGGARVTVELPLCL